MMYPHLVSVIAFILVIMLCTLRPSSRFRVECRLRRLRGNLPSWETEDGRRRLGMLCALLACFILGGMVSWPLALLLLLASGLAQVLFSGVLRPRGIRINDEQVERLCTSLINRLRAGHSLPSALDNSADHVGPALGTALRLAMTRHQAGIGLMASLHQMAADGAHSPSLEYLVEILSIHHESGGELTILLALTAATLRERRVARQELMSRTVEARLSATILAMLPVFVALLLLAWQPATLHPLFSESVGRMGLLLASVCWLLGVLTTNRLVHSVAQEVG